MQLTMQSSQNGNPTSNMLQVQAEIKRLQQLQRLRAATTACNFPSVGGSGGLLPGTGNNLGNSNNVNLGLSTCADSTLVSSSRNLNLNNMNSTGLNMNSMNMNRNNNVINSMGMNSMSTPSGGGAGTGSSNPVLASLLAKQQQQQQQQHQQEETRLMLLQHQLRLKGSNTASNNINTTNSGAISLQQQQQLLNSNLLSSAFSPSSALAQQQQQQQLQLQQQLQQQQLQLQQQQQNQGQGLEALAVRPLMRVGAIEPFPEKLHRMLMEVEQCQRGDIISFINNGRGFAIHKPDSFFKEIVPLYFRHSRLSSFKRQLNLYGFEQINIGPYRGGYYHEMFHRDDPELCRRMRRVAVKVSGATTQRKKEQEAQRAKLEAERKRVEQAQEQSQQQQGGDGDNLPLMR